MSSLWFMNEELPKKISELFPNFYLESQVLHLVEILALLDGIGGNFKSLSWGTGEQLW